MGGVTVRIADPLSPPAAAVTVVVPCRNGVAKPIARQNATATGTDIPAYISEHFGASVFTLQDGAVYQTYWTTGRGVEFLMGYYPILDRTPKGRDEGDAFQTWIRRHDEYEQHP